MNKIKFLTYISWSFLLFLVGTIHVGVELPQFSYGDIRERSGLSYETVASLPQPAALAKSPVSSDSLVFVGDVLLSRNVEFLMQQHGLDYPYRAINFSNLAINPIIVGNFESTIPENHVPTEARKINFSVASKYLSALRMAGFTHLSLANNHSYDFGESAYTNTKQKLSDNDLKTFGDPNALSEESITFFSAGNKFIAVVGLHTLKSIPSQSEIEALLKRASIKSDFQIVYVHWGTEYEPVSDERQRRLAKSLVRAGADLIVGHHPHVVQEIELVDGVPVFYSLGNYIFDQYFSTEVQEGLMINIEFGQKPLIHLLPVTSELVLSQPAFMDNKSHQDFLTNLADRSDPNISEYIHSGILPLNIPVASSVKMAMISS